MENQAQPPSQPPQPQESNQPQQQSHPSQPVNPPATPGQINPPPQPVTPVSSQNPNFPASPPPKRADTRLKWLIILVLLFVGFLVVAAWYFQSQLQKSMQTAVKPINTTTVTTTPAATTLVIGTDPTFPPMEYIKNGKMVGFDIDLANLIAKQMGVKVQFKNIVFDNLFDALDAKQINLIIAGVSITPEREQKYDFSIPYINAGEVIITQKANEVIITTAQLKDKRIGVQKDTTDEQEALKFTPTNDVIPYPTFDQATQALVAGQIDAIVTDLPDAQGIVASSPTLKIASDPFTNEYYGIAFRKGDPMRNRINTVLKSLQQRGYLIELRHKWLY